MAERRASVGLEDIINIKRMVKSRAAKVTFAATLAVGAVVGSAAPAFASTEIDYTMYSPGSAGKAVGSLYWASDSEVNEDGFLYDLAADGHGPYVHFIAARAYNGTSYQFDSDHNTQGSGSYEPYGGLFSDRAAIVWVDVWVCNGGTSTGNTAQGCYGRRAFNQITYPGKASESLGNTTGSVY